LKIIGVLGGIASGKSVVTTELKNLGATVFDADRAGHKVLQQPPVIPQLVDRFSVGILDSQGQIDRKQIAKRVFGKTSEHSAALRDLERITHPLISQELDQSLAQARIAQVPAFVLDAPVMIKAGWDTKCDEMIYVDALRENRLARAQQRGWTVQDFDDREANQEKLDQKRRLATFIVDNNGALEDLQDQVRRFWKSHISTS